MACHILIIPLNTNRGNLIKCQQAIMDMCMKDQFVVYDVISCFSS